MRIRRFQAKTLEEALAQVKRALGEDAVVIASRPLKRGGIFGERLVEVTAAADDRRPLPRASHTAGPSGPRQVRPTSTSHLSAHLGRLQREVRALRGALVPSGAGAEDASFLRREVEELRRLLGQLVTPSDAPAGGGLARLLVALDVRPDVAEALASEVERRLRGNATREEDGLDATAAVLAERMARHPYVAPRGRARLALVGPTGAGKTTTIAKLAARAALVEGKRVALVGADTYRLGAADQLDHYARLMHLPHAIVSSREGLRASLRRFEEADLVLIDTAGRNPGDTSGIRALSSWFSGQGVETHLVIPASTRHIELWEILGRYRPLDARALIFSKVDEATVLGAVVNAIHWVQTPLSYLTTGQRVPEDLERVHIPRLARRIFAPEHRIAPTHTPETGLREVTP